MRGSLRVHSVLGLAIFLGWSLLVNVRERLAPLRQQTSPPRTAPQAARPQPKVDPKLWN